MNAGTKIPDLLVVGGGVVGLSAAWEVATRGHRVTVIERASVAREASWAAAGMLSPLGEAAGGGPMLEFGKTSLALWAEWAAEVEQCSDACIEYETRGKLQVAVSSREVERLRSLQAVGTSAGVRCTWLERPDLLDLEPAVTTDALGALYMEDDAAVDNRALGGALAAACRNAGVEVVEDARVHTIRLEDGAASGVVLESGTRIGGGAVLVAAGAWSDEIAGLPLPVPVVPIRGQMLALRPTEPPSKRILGHGHVYVVPRGDGRVLVGATMEEAGFEKATTREGLAQLLDGAVELVPSLGTAPIVERWSGLRPGSADGLPIIGSDPRVARLHYATGHFRNGILLAPATASAVADLFEHGSSSLLPREFRPDRFGADASASGASGG